MIRALIHCTAPLRATIALHSLRWAHSAPPLPRQPVPDLRKTLTRYLRSLQPLVDDDELESTRELVAEFLRPGGQGEELQRLLHKRAERTDNWLTDWRQECIYLENHLPLPVHSSPAVILPQQEYKDWRGQLRFASKLICGVLDFKAKIESPGGLEELWRGQRLCPDQYYKFFGSCREPGTKRDRVLLHPRSKSHHVTVCKNYQFFELDVYNSDGSPLTEDQIHQQMLFVRAHSKKTDKEPVGVLTTDHRNSWGRAYGTLIRDRLNRESVRSIQRSLFTVCLDATVLKYSEDLYSSRTAAQMLHGGGSHANSGNRWFDKTLQFVVGEDGTCGLIYDQATADASAVLTMLHNVFDYCSEGPGLLPPRTPLTRVPSPRKLYFNFPPEIKQHVEQAKQNLDMLVNDLDICCFSFSDFGKKFPQRYNMSPGTFLQICLQLAYYRLHGSLCTTTEAVSLRAFHRGRSDVVRCSSPEVLEFVQAADDPQKQAEEKCSLLVKAVESQQEATEQVLQGQSVDGAILALKMLCLSSGMALPTLFMDTSYAVSSHWKLFTGQVSSPLDCVMCYGPLVPDGYSVCFAPTQDSVTVCVSAFDCCQETDAERLSDSLQGALRDVHALILNAPSQGEAQSPSPL
ncbi:carnitine O-acetyltransferase-like [Phyllobates terribilis]|uniref:carnitine O-acetyltransferase-like n=1 Tax=Phyllobates terribilis TaxID=111132 RepID=UPI003CCB1630